MTSRPFDFGNAKLSIVVPVFNEAHRITANLDLLIDEIEEYFPSFEVIVVSDGSTDGTNVRLFAFRHPGVRPILIEKNAGKGNAVRSGFQRATGDYVLFIDGGMEIHPREIRIFMGLMSLYQADIVIGSKRHPQSNVKYPLHRRVLSWFFQRLVHFLFQVDVTDTQVGIKLFRKEVVDAILPDLEINRYGFDLELLSLAKLKGYANVLEAPIRMDYFGKNDRMLARELVHVARVSLSLLKDTLQLYFRLRKLRASPQPEVQSDSIRRVG